MDGKTSDVDSVVDLVRPGRLTAVVDIGASLSDGGDPPYKALLNIGTCSVIGFEPQDAELRNLIKGKTEAETYLPYVVGDGRRAMLYVTHAGGMTSTFEPDPVVLNHFAKFSEWGRVVGKVEVDTRRLDDIDEIENLDFLKVDIQGGELAVLKNGAAKLKNAAVVQVEVSFASIYKGQPTFADVDMEMRSQGFIPHCFFAINRRLIAPLTADDPSTQMNHLIEADMVYVHDFMRPDSIASDQLKQLAIIAHHCYRSYDLAMNCIFHLVRRKDIAADAMLRYASIIKTLR